MARALTNSFGEPLLDFEGEVLFPESDQFRLEPLPRSNEVASGLAARIHDPAWALTRQWQFGEFAGQDAGSPVLVEISGSTVELSHWRPSLDDSQPWVPYEVKDGPLDRLIEAEEVAPEGERLRVEGGAHFARLLAERGLGEKLPELVEAFGFEPPLKVGEEETDLVALLAAKVPDAERLAAEIAAGPLPVEGVAAVASDWADWWAERHPDPGPDSFDPHRFEHSASFSTPGRVLCAEEYMGDGLDWFSVDVDTAAAGEPGGTTRRFEVEALPSPVQYGGLPADRFWEMEDREIDLDSTEADTLDTGRLLLIAFAEVYGNDWFLLPLEVPVGARTSIERLRVKDTFGQITEIERAGRDDPAWNLFTLEGDEEAGLLTMPTAPAVSGDALERVALARDELANLSWAIEAEYTDERGRPVNRRDQWLASEPEQPGAGYAVQTIVPAYWLPLVPHQIAPGQIRFALVPLEQFGKSSEARGRLLRSVDWLHEEEVPREGAEVIRKPVLARWFNGATYAWVRRQKNPGGGESASGLAFDIVRPSDPWP